MQPDLNSLALRSFRGGLNLADPPAFIRDDQVVVAENVDFADASLGATRNGVRRIETPTLYTVTVCALARWFPTNDPAETILIYANVFDVGTSRVCSFAQLDGDEQTALGGLIGTSPSGDVTTWPLVSMVSIHGKLFVAVKTGADRLAVLDPGSTSFRPAGLATLTSAPSVTNTGSGSYEATERFYRVRLVRFVNGVRDLRSEPSASVAFTPSGSNQAARISISGKIPSTVATHWELEASEDDVNFYRITTVGINTTTYDDSAPPSSYSSGTLSEDIGDYTLLWSAKFLSVDDDRLIIGGSWEDENLASRVAWTPVYGGPGVGNDERLELDTDPFLDLDGFEGGELTGLGRATNGYLYAFKESHIYKLVRRKSRAQSYEAILITKQAGAIVRSVVSAFDEFGNPAEYFWDSIRGPQRIGTAGLEDVGRDIRPIAQRVNLDAKVPVFGLYYPERKQVWYWVAVDGADFPNLKLVFQIRDGQRTDEGVRGGWVAHTGTAATATAGCLYAQNVGEDAPRDRTLRPVVGYQRPDYLALYDTAGTYEWEAPFSGFVTVVAIGGGGSTEANATTTGAGGGGGGAGAVGIVEVVQGNTYTVTVGAGGAVGGVAGGASSFESDVIAAGGGIGLSNGTGGTGGLAANSTGNVFTGNGGDGGNGHASGGGGGGGMSANGLTLGVDGDDATGSTGGQGGDSPADGSVAGFTPGRGDGGNGGDIGDPGVSGQWPGGGGGGEGAGSSATPSTGGDGAVAISYASWLGIADEGETDMGDPYSATLTSKPFSPRGLLRKIGAMNMTILARARESAGFLVQLTRDYGKEVGPAIAVDTTPEGSETHVFRELDDAHLSELHALQITLKSDDPPTPWQVDQLAVQLREEERT